MKNLSEQLIRRSVVRNTAMLVAFALVILCYPGISLAQSPPTGPAGGDLSGTYPNPVLAVDRVRKVGDTMTGQLNITLPNAGGLVYPFSLSSSGNTGPNRGIGFQFNLPANPSAVLGAQMTVARENWGLSSYFSFSTHNGTAIAEALRIAGSGNVGIGTTSPGSRLAVEGPVITAGDAKYLIQAIDTAAQATGVGGGIVFTGKYDTAGNLINWSSVQGIKENGTSGNYAGALIFTTRAHGSTPAERMRINSAGKVGIGTTTPGAFLQVGPGAGYGTTHGLLVSPNLTGSTYDRAYQIAPTQTASASGNSTLMYVVPTIPSGVTQPTMYGLYVDGKQGAGTITNYYPAVFLGGNVGIGTSAPTSKLDVSGTINATGLTVNGAAVTSSQWITSGSNINYAPAGSVGIGIASPTAKLDVNGTVNATGLTVNGTAVTSSQWTTSGSNINYAPAGNVGIGITSPTAKLHVNGTVNATGLMVNGTAVTSSQWTTSGSNINYAPAGNVGIGTASPTTKLDVSGTVNATGLTVNGTPVASSQWTTSGSNINYAPAGNVGIGIISPTAKLHVNGTVNATGLMVNGTAVTSSQWTTSGSNINYAPAGNVGIGTASPTTKLDVSGTVNATGLTVNGTPVTSSQWATNGVNINYAAGNVGIGTISPTTKLHVVGDGKVTGNLTVDGTINAKYQDVAEWVPATHALPAGTVAVLNPNHSNQVMASSQAYDTRVAGVISQQPGIVLGESGPDKVLVATTGRVRVKVDATHAPIRIGDLLVASDKEGMAMKSQPIIIGGVEFHRPGTLIGKALEPLAKGQGEILVLLSLQ